MARPLPRFETGTKFNSWTVLDPQAINVGKHIRIKCQCKCGKIDFVRTDQLKFGNSKSCGCLASDHDLLAKKFWQKAAKKESGCWEWNKCKTGGYGITIFKGRSWRAHRLSYFLTFGEFDFSLHVLHKCDNPSCINPEHLFLGTTQDNNADCVAKQRHVRGEMRNFKLLEKHVIAIRELREKHKIPIKELARIFDVSYSMVEKIIYRKEWKHI